MVIESLIRSAKDYQGVFVALIRCAVRGVFFPTKRSSSTTPTSRPVTVKWWRCEVRRIWSFLGRHVTAIVFGGLALAAAYAVYAATFFEKGLSPQTHVEITLTHPTLDSVGVSVPIEYLGPTFLELSKKNRLGGEQNKFLVQFFYPSFLPITTKNDEVIKNERKVYMSVEIGAPGAIRRIGEKFGNFLWYSETGKTICGLKEFGQVEKNVTNDTRYYGRNENSSQMDVMFYCDDDVYEVPCHVRIEGEVKHREDVSLYIVFNGYRKKDLCEWEGFSQKIRDFTNRFVITGE